MAEWVAADGRFVVQLPSAVLSHLHEHCGRGHPDETGGVLTGRYEADHRVAHVTAASAPPTDSRSGRTWFVRGIVGLADRFARVWGRSPRAYYLGEWHYHPSSDVRPSGRDRKQMRAIARDPRYHCPEPLLIIVGSAAAGHPLHAEVVLASGKIVRLSNGGPPYSPGQALGTG